MNRIPTVSRVHPLMAGATAFLVILGIVGTAAITGLLPTAHSAPAPAKRPAAASAVDPAAPMLAAADAPAATTVAQAASEVLVDAQ